MSSPRIAVFGSINMDLVAYVDTAPGPGETVSGTAFETISGGKGANQAVAAARAGGSVHMIGAVGGDVFGARLREGLDNAGIDVTRLRTVEGPSGTAHIVVDARGENSIVVVASANGTLHEVHEQDDHAIASADVLLLQLETPVDGVLAAARCARRNGTRVVLTPAPAQPLSDELLELVDLLVPNQHELRALTQQDDLDEALAQSLRRIPEIVVTLGGDGCRYATAETSPVSVPAIPVDAVDTTAAGDTFVGALAVSQAEGRAMETSLRWAGAAAALSVQRRGASSSMPERAEIDKLFATSW